MKRIDKVLRRLLIECGKCSTLHYAYELRSSGAVWRVHIDRWDRPTEGALWEYVCKIREVTPDESASCL